MKDIFYLLSGLLIGGVSVMIIMSIIQVNKINEIDMKYQSLLKEVDSRN